jgi:hypothetical protein
MPFLRHTSFSLVTLVVFLALAAIASYLYSGPPGERVELNENALWQKISASWKSKNNGIFAEKNPESNIYDNYAGGEGGAGGAWWNNLKERFLTEWEKSGQAAVFSEEASQIDLGPEAEAALGNIKSFSWQVHASGFEISFNFPSGREFRLEIPYKFWHFYF